jgi:hypothetical protein
LANPISQAGWPLSLRVLTVALTAADAGHAMEEKQLEDADAQGHEGARFHLAQRMLGKAADDVVKVVLVPQHPVDQSLEQAAVDLGQPDRLSLKEQVHGVVGGGPEAERLDGGGTGGGR